MNSNSMDSNMQDMDPQNGGMRHHISRKAEPPADIVPTVAVHDFINNEHKLEETAEHQIETRGKIQRSK